MTKTEQIKEVLENMGYSPVIDEDGDLSLRYQLKHIYFLVNDEEEDPFVNVVLPQFYSFEEDEATLYLAACNKVTRDTKMVKVFVDQTFCKVTASCEFYFANNESLQLNLEKSLKILSVIRSNFRNTILLLKED